MRRGISRREVLAGGATIIALGAVGSIGSSRADTLVLHEGDLAAQDWLRRLSREAHGTIAVRRVALLETGSIAAIGTLLAQQAGLRLIALVGDGEAVVLEAMLQRAQATKLEIGRHGGRVLIAARL